MSGIIRIAILANGKQARAEMERTGLAGTSMGKSVSRAAKAMGLAFAGFEAAHLAGEMVKSAGEFQKATTLLVTAGGEAQKNLGLVSDGILKVSSATGTSATDLADGMYLIEKAGIRGAAGLTVLKNAAEGAKAENVDMATETQAVTSIMTSYHKKASDSAAVVNQLVVASGQAKTTMQEFAGSLASVLPSASAAKLSFAEVGGAIATLTQHGTSAKEATQELAFTIRNLQAPNQVASREMQQLGINVTDLSKNLGKRGLTGTLQLVEQAILKHMGKSGLVLLDAFRKSKTAGDDLQIMLHNMPPDLQKVSKAFLSGSRSGKDYTADIKGMGGGAFAMGMQFKALVQQSQGFNDVLKSGGSAQQTYTDALKKIMGGAVGMNTALQLSGENMAGFKARVEEVNKAAKDKSGVTTWAQTAHTFDVQSDRVKQSFKNLGIELALPALPGLAKLFSGLANGAADAAPQIQSMFLTLKPLGDVVKFAAEGLGAIPGPLKTIALEAGIAALVFPRLAAGVTSAAGAMAGQVTMARVLALQLKEDGVAATAASFGMGSMTRSIGTLAGIGGMVALTVGAQKGNKAVAGLGGALAGAAIGAQVGTAIFPGLGTAVGGIIGGVGGLALGMNSVHKKTDAATSSTEAMNRELARKQAIQERKAEIDQLVTTLNHLTGATTRATRQTVFSSLLGSEGGPKAIATLEKLGFTQGQVTDIITNRNSAAAKSYAKLQDQITRYARLSKAFLNANTTTGGDIQGRGGTPNGPALTPAQTKELFRLQTRFSNAAPADLQKLTGVINSQIGVVGKSQALWKQLQLGIRKYIGTLKGVPKDVATYFRTVGGKGTLADAEKIAHKFHVVDGTTAKLILKAEGLKPTKGAIADLVAAAKDARPRIKGAIDLSGLSAGAPAAGKKTSTNFFNGMFGDLSGVGKQKTGLALQQMLTSGTTTARPTASTGGKALGNSVLTGFIGALIAGRGPLAAEVRSLIASAARSGGGGGGGGGGSSTPSLNHYNSAPHGALAPRQVVDVRVTGELDLTRAKAQIHHIARTTSRDELDQNDAFWAGR